MNHPGVDRIDVFFKNKHYNGNTFDNPLFYELQINYMYTYKQHINMCIYIHNNI